MLQAFRSRSRSSYETWMTFASLSRRRATQVAVWFEGCVSWEFGKTSQHVNRVFLVLDNKIWGNQVGFPVMN